MFSIVRSSLNLRLAVYAGIVAGVAATVVQIALWAGFTNDLPWVLYRDARLTAAILMGREVLPPPAVFAWDVMLAATLVHFALAILYSMVLACFISRLGTMRSLLAGILYGLVLYGINMHGFTIVFPWFSVVRDWITIVTHAVFGAAMAGAYMKLNRATSSL
ncbi:MAG: sodium:proline symporter [Gallionella sp.]